MQTVVRYNMGGPVGFDLGGSIDLDNLRLDQRQLRLPQNQAFIEAMDNRMSGQNPRSVNLPRVTGISNVLKATPRAALPAAVLAELADTALNTSVDREGIMSTTPKFAGAEGQNRRPGITREQFDAMSPEDQQGYFQTEQDRLAAISTLGGIAEEVAIIPDMAQNIYEGIAGSDIVQRGLKAAGILDPTSQFERTRPRDFEERAVRTKAMNRPFESIEEFRASLPSEEGPVSAGRVVEPTVEYLQQMEQATGLPPGSIRPPTSTVTEEDDLGFDLGDVTDTIPRPKGPTTDATTETTTDATTTEATAGATTTERATTEGVTTDVPPGEADKAQAEAADIAAIFDSQNIVSDTDPVGTAVGTDMEALKKRVMDLMPQWDEEASVKRNGLLLAQMGAAIAAGKSGDAITNIAEGMQKVLPEFVKEGRMRDKFKAELEGGAAKIAATEGLSREREERAEQRAIAKENRQKKAYYLGQDVDVTIDGKRFVGTMGQLIPLTNPQLDKAIQAGIPLTAKEVVVEQMKQNAQNIANKGTLADFYEEKAVSYAGFESTGGYKSPFKGLNYYRPNVQGAQIGLAKVWRPDTLDELEARYTQEKNTLMSSMSLVNNIYASADSATGLGATFNRAKDSLVALVGKENAKRFGLDADLSTTGELDVMQRFLAAQMAPIILGESGKTISDEDRRRIGRAIGFDPDSKEFKEKLFRNPDQIRAAMKEVAGILQKYDSALQSEYSSLLRGAFKGGPQGFEAIQLPEPQQPVGKTTSLTADQFAELVGLSQ